MINPKLGTRPRPDVTGEAEYSAAPKLSGINPMPITPGTAFWVPWGALEISFDFPEDKYPVTNYQVELSLFADFEMGVPEAERKGTGISGSPAAGTFKQGVVAINPYDGGPPASIALQPGTQYHARVRAVLAASNSEWSEPLSFYTEPLPSPNGMGDDGAGNMKDSGPIASYTYGVVGLVVTITDTSVANPVTASPLHDLRFGLMNNRGIVLTEPPGTPAAFTAEGPGTYRFAIWVTDEAGFSAMYAQDIVVVGP